MIIASPPPIALPKADIRIVPEDEIKARTIDGRTYLFHTFRWVSAPGGHVSCTMHRIENTNNLEVFRVALYCRKHAIRLTMIGTVNQFPLFSTFADDVILEDVDANDRIYEDTTHKIGHTTYRPPCIPSLWHVTDLCLKAHREHGQPMPEIIQKAMMQITDDEVIAEFARVTVHVRSQSYALFNQIEKRLPSRAIVAEIKEFAGCHGAQFRALLERRAIATGLIVITDRAWLRSLCAECGKHYMAVQCLASIFRRWSWICYGGSSNLFAFFPFKILLLSDAYVWPALSLRLACARYQNPHGFPLLNEEQEQIFNMDAAMSGRVRSFTGQ